MGKIVLENINKSYGNDGCKQYVLKDICFSVESGDMISIMGPSGSGKSTLLNILGLLDKADSGSYYIDDINITEFDEKKTAELRNKKFGFVFQSFNLIKELTALENVKLTLSFSNIFQKGKNKLKNVEMERRSKELLESVGLKEHMNKFPAQLSGGQQQRVALARALVNDPDIILADEPTGALDVKNGNEIMNMLEELNKKGKTIIIVTHDSNIAKRCKRNISMLDGQLN